MINSANGHRTKPDKLEISIKYAETKLIYAKIVCSALAKGILIIMLLTS